jgi:hypothetical protein
MKTFKFAERTVICGEALEWDQLLKACADDREGTVVDLRTFLELAEQVAPKPPEGWGYRRLPVTGATVSEQDLDVFRREFYRKPQTVVVGPNAARAELMVAASVARYQQGGWNGQDLASSSQDEWELLEWLTAYLVRHGVQQASALQALAAGRPPSARGTKSVGSTEKGRQAAPTEQARKPAAPREAAEIQEAAPEPAPIAEPTEAPEPAQPLEPADALPQDSADRPSQSAPEVSERVEPEVPAETPPESEPVTEAAGEKKKKAESGAKKTRSKSSSKKASGKPKKS